MKPNRNTDPSFDEVLAQVAKACPSLAARCEEARRACRELDRQWLAAQAEHAHMHRELDRRRASQEVGR